MLIVKGDGKYSIVNITPMELLHLYDAFQSGRHNFIELLKGTDKELAAALGQKEKDIPKVRKSLQEKIELYFKQQQKIQEYAKQKG